MAEDKDPEILDIANTISEMNLVDSGQLKRSKENTVSICESDDCLETPSRNESADNQDLKIPDNEQKVSETDQDQDRAHPAYVPRTGQFFMHDTRESDAKIALHSLSRADHKWRHDLYNETDQIPMSDREFAKKYGVDREGNPVSLVRHGMHDMNRPQIGESMEVRNAACHVTTAPKIHGHGTSSQDKRKSVGNRRFNKHLPFTYKTLRKGHFDVWGSRNKNSQRCEKLAKDACKAKETNTTEQNTDHNHVKLKTRLGKRYSTQRPMKSVEV